MKTNSANKNRKQLSVSENMMYADAVKKSMNEKYQGEVTGYESDLYRSILTHLKVIRDF